MLNDKLNELLANYGTMFHKLQTFHWYVKGHAFFQAHAKLEEYYTEAYEAVDEIAEKILMNGGTPLAGMAEFQAKATIEETTGEFRHPREIFDAIRADFESLLAQVVDVKRAADDEGNYLISAFADGLVEQLSKNLWMLRQSQD